MGFWYRIRNVRLPYVYFWDSMGNMLFHALMRNQNVYKTSPGSISDSLCGEAQLFSPSISARTLHLKMKSAICLTIVALCSTLIQGLPQIIVSRTVIGDPGGPGFTFSIPDFPTNSRTVIEGPTYTFPTDLPTTSTSKKPVTTSKTTTSKLSKLYVLKRG